MGAVLVILAAHQRELHETGDLSEVALPITPALFELSAAPRHNMEMIHRDEHRFSASAPGWVSDGSKISYP
jgi:hypothetical protein